METKLAFKTSDNKYFVMNVYNKIIEKSEFIKTILKYQKNGKMAINLFDGAPVITIDINSVNFEEFYSNLLLYGWITNKYENVFNYLGFEKNQINDMLKWFENTCYICSRHVIDNGNKFKITDDEKLICYSCNKIICRGCRHISFGTNLTIITCCKCHNKK